MVRPNQGVQWDDPLRDDSPLGSKKTINSRYTIHSLHGDVNVDLLGSNVRNPTLPLNLQIPQRQSSENKWKDKRHMQFGQIAWAN